MDPATKLCTVEYDDEPKALEKKVPHKLPIKVLAATCLPVLEELRRQLMKKKDKAKNDGQQQQLKQQTSTDSPDRKKT